MSAILDGLEEMVRSGALTDFLFVVGVCLFLVFCRDDDPEPRYTIRVEGPHDPRLHRPNGDRNPNP